MGHRRGPGRRPSLLAACLLCSAAAQAGTSTGTVTVTATVLSKNVCKLSSNNVLAMDFLSINAASTQPQTKQLTWTFTCKGSSATAAWTVDAGDGLHASGPALRRMQHGTVATEFLPYSLSISPSSGTAPKGTVVTVTLTGTVAPSSFQPALPGSYSDTVAITVAP